MIAPDAVDKARVALRDAHAAWKRGEHELALARARAAVGFDPSYAAAWTLLGTFRRDQDPQDAEQALRRALALQPRFEDPGHDLLPPAPAPIFTVRRSSPSARVSP